MKTFIPIVLAIYLISLAPISAMGYKRYSMERSPCINEYNRGIINQALESRTNAMFPNTDKNSVILKLYEDCVKANEGVRFKKNLPIVFGYRVR